MSWQAITALGDTGVMLPVAALIGLWLASARHYRLAGKWCLTVVLVGCIVAVSKLLFMGWCVRLPDVDFTGFSGHAAMAAIVMPVLAQLVQQTFARRFACDAWPIGVALALLVGFSRLAVHVHSLSEVVAGLVLGLTFGLTFLQSAAAVGRIDVNPRLATLSLMSLPCLLWLQPAPTQLLLEQIAILMSGQRTAFTRQATACDLPEWQVMHLPAANPIRRSDAAESTASNATDRDMQRFNRLETN